MGGPRTTLHINLPLEMKVEMERVARELALPSSTAYVAFLHSTMGIAVQPWKSWRSRDTCRNASSRIGTDTDMK